MANEEREVRTRMRRVKSRRKRRLPRLRALALAALLGATVAGTADAQDPDEGVRVGLTYEPGYIPVLALPDVRGAEDALAVTAARVDTILRRDIEYSDRFEMLPVPDTLERSSETRYELWNELGAVWLVTGEVTGTPARPLLRLSLHDVVYGDLREVRAFSLPGPGSDGFRMAVHRAADALVEWATGEPGMAASRIAFRRKSGEGASDIWIVDSDGHGLRRVTHDSSIVYSPAFSPDGTELMYVSYVEGFPAVYRVDVETGRRRVVSAVPGVNLSPTYRPDGERIALARSVEGSTEVFELQADPLCCSRRLTFTSGGDALGPSYSPDGDRIAFEATPLGEQQVYVKDVEGGSPTLISKYVFGERGSSASPDWSPTGDRIVLQAWIDGMFQVVSVNPDGGDRRVLTAEGANEEPSWAPDGRHVVFRSNRRGYHGLWILDTVTGNLRRLVANHVDQMPEWSNPIPPPGAPGSGG